MEQVNLSMGVDAGEFLDQLPQPDPQKEAEFLVATADCKGVPLLKKDAAKVKAFQTAKKRPGNRRMATVTSLYSVDPYHRTAEDLLAALFREQPTEVDASTDSTARPEPKFKHTTAHFPTVAIDGEDDEEIQISGIHQGLGWLSSEVQSRRAKDQKLIVLMDGQEALWDTSAMHFCDEQTVELLDYLHVAVYVWAAAALFHQSSEMKEAFTYDRLARLLAGDVKGVIRGLRRMGSLHKLAGGSAEDCARITGYLEKHAARMKYDEYLAMGYPICFGVIEGACRHLVKDRMERSGMRWSLEGARACCMFEPHIKAITGTNSMTNAKQGSWTAHTPTDLLSHPTDRRHSRVDRRNAGHTLFERSLDTRAMPQKTFRCALRTIPSDELFLSQVSGIAFTRSQILIGTIISIVASLRS
ncbi:hypothetical protein CA85_52740 [Allorhodopirellula solitaria]|uniref:ISKra4 family transposase n=1 Tax=Allorhodopirellula solitaria TaxID=2527987 RepID=A0A5C5WJM9_9BACT|nr:hypothetical protein CA85_52740 [Allorhodopirellula solitaria]